MILSNSVGSILSNGRFGTAKRLNEAMDLNKYFESVGATVSHKKACDMVTPTKPYHIKGAKMKSTLPSFPSSCLGMSIGGRNFKKGYFNQNTRRFGTAKRLKQLLNAIEDFLNQRIFRDFHLFIPIQHILSFGSAKPTKVESICRVDKINRLRGVKTTVTAYNFILTVDCIHLQQNIPLVLPIHPSIDIVRLKNE